MGYFCASVYEYVRKWRDWQTRRRRVFALWGRQGTCRFGSTWTRSLVISLLATIESFGAIFVIALFTILSNRQRRRLGVSATIAAGCFALAKILSETVSSPLIWIIAESVSEFVSDGKVE